MVRLAGRLVAVLTGLSRWHLALAPCLALALLGTRLTRRRARPADGRGTGCDEAHREHPAVQVRPEAPVLAPPVLAPEVRLLGSMEGTAYRDQQWMVERGGRFLQLTELLYRVAALADGRHTLDDIAAATSEATGLGVSAENVRYLLVNRLVPARLVLWEGEPSPPPLQENRVLGSPLSVNARMLLIGPNRIDPIARVLRHLYLPVILGPVLLAVAASHGWLYLVHGVSGGLHAALQEPALLLLVMGLLLLSTAFHELGHAAALRYGGGRVRGIGVGFYMVYPAFFTDVTENYRLGRWARLRTDLGGFYFNLVFSLALLALYAVTGQEFLLLVVVLIDLEILYQLIPLVRLDGYWVLADLTGIPDFFSLMGAFLRSLLPVPGWKGSRLPELKWWAKAVFALYVVLVVPLIAFLIGFMVVGAPRLVMTAWSAFLIQTEGFSAAWSLGDFVGASASAVRMFSLALPPLGVSFMIFGLGQTAVLLLRRLSLGTRLRRAVLGAFGGGLLLSFLWLPGASFADRGLDGLHPSVQVEKFEAGNLFVGDGIYGTNFTMNLGEEAEEEAAPGAEEIELDDSAPRASFEVRSFASDEGNTTRLSLTDPSVPGEEDSGLEFRYSFTCDPEGAPLVASYEEAGTDHAFTCSLFEKGAHTVKARIFGRSGAFTTYRAVVVVGNVDLEATSLDDILDEIWRIMEAP